MIDRLPLLAWPTGSNGSGVLATLIFHRVLPEPDPLRPGEPDRDKFARMMKFISRNFDVLDLAEAALALRDGKLPRRACCITFDDGYADNLTVALPILEQYQLPATIFVATGYLDGGRMFNDSVIEIVKRTQSLHLDLTTLELGSYPLRDNGERRIAIDDLQNKLKYLPPEERDEMIERIAALAGSLELPDDLMLTSTQVCELARRGISIGGHTVAHTILTTLDDEQARNEIRQGKLKLEELIGKKVKAFAYPNGRPGTDFDSRHVAMIREQGFEVAVTTASGVGRPESDSFQLPRFTPWGKSEVAWAMRLTRNALPQATADC